MLSKQCVLFSIAVNSKSNNWNRFKSRPCNSSEITPAYLPAFLLNKYLKRKPALSVLQVCNDRKLLCTFYNNSPGMKLTAWSFVSCVLVAILFVAATTSAYPASNPEIMYNMQAIENMRQIPQWHCLRYRKFDLVRRCRNYRLGRKH